MFGLLDPVDKHQCCVNHFILEKKCTLFKAKLFRKTSPTLYEELKSKLQENLPTDCTIEEAVKRLSECQHNPQEGYFKTLFQAFKTVTYVFSSPFLTLLKEESYLIITDYNWRHIIKKDCMLSKKGKELLKAFVPSNMFISENSGIYQKMRHWHDYYRLKEALKALPYVGRVQPKEDLKPNRLELKKTLKALSSSANTFPKISDRKTCTEIEAKLNKLKGPFDCTDTLSQNTFSPLMWFPDLCYERIKELNQWYKTISSILSYKSFVILVKNSLVRMPLEKIEFRHVESIKFAYCVSIKYKIIAEIDNPHFLSLCQTSEKLVGFLKYIEIYSAFNEEEEYFKFYLIYKPPIASAPARPIECPPEKKQKETLVKEEVKEINELDIDALLEATFEDFVAMDSEHLEEPGTLVVDNSRLKTTQEAFHLMKWKAFKDRAVILYTELPNDCKSLIKIHLDKIETEKKLLSGEIYYKILLKEFPILHALYFILQVHCSKFEGLFGSDYYIKMICNGLKQTCDHLKSQRGFFDRIKEISFDELIIALGLLVKKLDLCAENLQCIEKAIKENKISMSQLTSIVGQKSLLDHQIQELLLKEIQVKIQRDKGHLNLKKLTHGITNLEPIIKEFAKETGYQAVIDGQMPLEEWKFFTLSLPEKHQLLTLFLIFGANENDYKEYTLPFIEILGPKYLFKMLSPNNRVLIKKFYGFYKSVIQDKKEIYSPTIVAQALLNLFDHREDFANTIETLGWSLNRMLGKNENEQWLLSECSKLVLASVKKDPRIYNVRPNGLSHLLLTNPSRLFSTLLPSFLQKIAPELDVETCNKHLEALAPLINEILVSKEWVEVITENEITFDLLFGFARGLKKEQHASLLEILQAGLPSLFLLSSNDDLEGLLSQLFIKHVREANAFARAFNCNREEIEKLIKQDEHIQENSHEKNRNFAHTQIHPLEKFLLLHLQNPLKILSRLSFLIKPTVGIARMIDGVVSEATIAFFISDVEELIDNSFYIHPIKREELKEKINRGGEFNGPIKELIKILIPVVQQFVNNHEGNFYLEHLKQLDAMIYSEVPVNEQMEHLETNLNEIFYHLLEKDLPAYESPILAALRKIPAICQNEKKEGKILLISAEKNKECTEEQKNEELIIGQQLTMKPISTPSIPYCINIINSSKFLSIAGITGIGCFSMAIHTKKIRPITGFRVASTVAIIALLAIAKKQETNEHK